MRVAIQTGTFKRDQDGVARTLYALKDSLLKEDIEVGIWSPAITPAKRKGLYLFRIPSVPFILYPEYRLALIVGGIRRQLNRFKPDVVQVTVPDFLGVYFLRYATKRGIPVVNSYHTDFSSYLKYFGLEFISKPGWRYLVWFYNQSDRIYAPTREMAKKLENKGIKNVNIWSRGINREKYHPRFRSDTIRRDWGALDKKVVLFCGRFVWYKDLHVVIRVYELFRRKGPKNVVFVMAGDGPVRKELMERMSDARFTGYLYGEDLSKVYASADIFLFPSTTETFGNVVQEALSSGLPAVVSDIGGCKETIINSGGGLIARADAPFAFYQSCRRLVEDEAFYEDKKRNGLRYAEEQTWDRINRVLIQSYRELVEKKKKRAERR